MRDLQKELTEATVFLPQYDVRQCGQLLRDLQDDLTKVTPARSKFSFARKASSQPSVSAKDLPKVENIPNVTNDAQAASSDNTNSRQPSPNAHSRTISDYHNKYIALPTPPSSSDGVVLTPKDYYLSNLSQCILNFITSPVAALHVKHLRDTLVIIGPVSGSVLIEDCENCVMLLACRQFRMHHTRTTAIYLHLPSHPIIEDCTDLTFAPYPVERLCASSSRLADLFEAAKLDTSPSTNQLHNIEDFSWLRQVKSPNWRLVGESEPVLDWVKLAELNREKFDDETHEPEHVLREVLPRKNFDPSPESTT
ncbi:tubulin binding cofactor C-domain-containing protein [Phlyctochytrium arcticum]|nr:tubulin binding cofactor C-domain-containing protein [Phlyctochytrium arcticum]